MKNDDLKEHEEEFSEIEDSVQDLKIVFKNLLNSVTVTTTHDNVRAEENVIKQL